MIDGNFVFNDMHPWLADADLRFDRSAVFGGTPDGLHYRGYRTAEQRMRAAKRLAERGARCVCFSDKQAVFALQVWPNSSSPGIAQ